MSEELIDKLLVDIDNITSIMKTEKKVNCKKSAKLIIKIYGLAKKILTKCKIGELNFATKFLQDNLYEDTIGKPIKEKKKQLSDIYKKFFFTIPDLISKIKLHIKNPNFLMEFKPLLEPFSQNLAKYICEKYGPDKVEGTINKIFSGISSSLVKGIGDGIGAIPVVGAVTNAVKGAAGAVGNGLKTVNTLAEMGNNEELGQAVKIADKYDKKGKKGGGRKKNKRAIKKCSKVIMFFLTNYLLNLRNKNVKTSKVKKKTKVKKTKKKKTKVKKKTKRKKTKKRKTKRKKTN